MRTHLPLFVAFLSCLCCLHTQIPRSGFSLFAVMGLVPVHAAELAMGFQDALRTALQQNNGLKAREYSLAALQEDIGVAASHLWPTVTFEERFLRTNNPTYGFMAKLNEGRFQANDFALDSLNNPDPLNDFQTVLSVQQPLFVPQARIGMNMSRITFVAGQREFQRQRAGICLEVGKAYCMILTAREYVNVAQKSLDDAVEHLRIASLRYDNETGLYSDILRAETAVTEARQRLVSARKNHVVGQRGLGMLLGLNDAVDVIEPLPLPQLKNIEYYIATARRRSDLLAMEQRQELAETNLTLAKAAALPTISLVGSYQLNDSDIPFGADGDSWQIGAILRWDVFDGARRNAEQRKAGYQVAEAREYLEAQRKAVAFQVFEAYQSVDEARTNMELARTALVSAEEGCRLVQVRFENSLSPMVDLLDAQVGLDNARASVVARENDSLIAFLTLAYASGTLLQDLGITESVSEE